VSRLRRRILARVRGHVDVSRLVARGLVLGHGVYVAPTAYVDPGRPWLIEVGDETMIGPCVIVLAHDASPRLHTGHTLVGRVRIGKRVYIGHGAIIMPGSTIGDEAVIRPGAVIDGVIPARSVAMGNPAVVVSDAATFERRHLEAIADHPVWPIHGWSVGRGITKGRKAEQREALADRCGYLKSPG
jgi:acetyltransferase-like isoleucine patch superfamily enzyme